MKRFKLSSCILILLSLAVLLFSQTACKKNYKYARTIVIRKQQPYGRFLTNGKGRSVYMFTKDSADTSSCYGSCAKEWPPVVSRYKKITTGKNKDIQVSVLGTTWRRDSTRQVVYNGHPLYYYKNDKKPGVVEGQGKSAYGGKWYLVKPNGKRVRNAGENNATKPNSANAKMDSLHQNADSLNQNADSLRP